LGMVGLNWVKLGFVWLGWLSWVIGCDKTTTILVNPSGFARDCVAFTGAILVAKRAARRRIQPSLSEELACPIGKGKVREDKETVEGLF
jgi:hypothetical protein